MCTSFQQLGETGGGPNPAGGLNHGTGAQARNGKRRRNSVHGSLSRALVSARRSHLLTRRIQAPCFQESLGRFWCVLFCDAFFSVQNSAAMDRPMARSNPGTPTPQSNLAPATSLRCQ